MTGRTSGPLSGVRIVEFAAIGPVPFAAMMLADMGADVLLVERPGAPAPDPRLPIRRGRRVVELDLKQPAGVAQALQLAALADVVLEGLRPGVMERLGLDPQTVLGINARIVYGRMTGWGQTGPLARTAGHDINYLAVSGALSLLASDGQPPRPPLNLLADYGGGSLYLVVGMLAALTESRRTGKGQVVDAAMCDGAANLLAMASGMRASGQWEDAPGRNWLSGDAHFYRCYECADGRHVAVGALEPEFYRKWREIAGLTGPEFDAQMDKARWPDLCRQTAALFKTRTRDEWMALFDGTDACVSPVLGIDESAQDPHMAARQTWLEDGGCVYPAAAPRFDGHQRGSRPLSSLQSVEEAIALWR